MDPNMTLLCSALESVLAKLESDETNADAWSEARNALRHYGVGEGDDEELCLAVECEDREALRTIVSGWVSGERLLLERDRAVLKTCDEGLKQSA